jgi:hypothetical protein
MLPSASSPAAIPDLLVDPVLLLSERPELLHRDVVS